MTPPPKLLNDLPMVAVLFERKTSKVSVRVHNRVLRSRYPALFLHITPPSRLSLRENPDPADLSKV